MGKILRTYMPFIRAGIQESVAYRVNFLCFALGNVLSSFIMYFIWHAVFLSSEGDTFMGFSMETMVVYLFVSFATGILTNNSVAYAIGEDIRDGSIAMRMIKPVRFDLTLIFHEIGNSYMSLVVYIPVIIGVEIYRFAVTGSLQLNIGLFLVYLLSLFLAFLINCYFNLCFGFSAFLLKNLWGANILKDTIVGFVSGATIPLAFMPEALRSVLQFLPFASLTYTPVMIYVGMYDIQTILFYLGLQLFWLAFFVGLSLLIWKNIVKYLCVQGG